MQGDSMQQIKATASKMAGMALLWVSLSALINVPTFRNGSTGAIVACVGFVCFCCGLALFAEGFKRDIIERLRRYQ